MNLKDRWDALDRTTQKWLLDNPGCQMLPRTITTVISKECGEDLATGLHGQALISREDQDFIRSMAAHTASA